MQQQKSEFYEVSTFFILQLGRRLAELELQLLTARVSRQHLFLLYDVLFLPIEQGASETSCMAHFLGRSEVSCAPTAISPCRVEETVAILGLLLASSLQDSNTSTCNTAN